MSHDACGWYNRNVPRQGNNGVQAHPRLTLALVVSEHGMHAA